MFDSSDDRAGWSEFWTAVIVFALIAIIFIPN